MSRTPAATDDDRLRDRQGRSIMLDGAPCPDPATTASLLPGVIVGEYLRRHAGSVRGRLLDLGAGNQPYAEWYGSRCASSVATDIAPHEGVGAISTAELLPFADHSFDTVLATEVLEHVTDAEAALDEIVRVLAPGGVVVVTVPFLYPIHEAPHDHRRLTSHGLEAALVRRGLLVTDLSAKGGAATLVANVGVTLTCAALRVLMLRRTGSPGGRASARLLRWIEVALLAARSRARPFPASARRVSLGYMAVARLP